MDELGPDSEIALLSFPRLHGNTPPDKSADLLESALTLKLNRLCAPNSPALELARKRLMQEMTAVRRRQYGEFFLALADVVSLADQQGMHFWCLWEQLNRSLVAHLLGANPLNPVTWQLRPPKWVEDRSGLHSHLTMMLHVSEADSRRLRGAAATLFGEVDARKLGLLPEPQNTTSSDRAFIESQPAHISLWSWHDIELQRKCLDLIEGRHGVRIELREIPLDSAEVFRLFHQGHTLGLFHVTGIPGSYFESAFRQLRPRDLRELAVIFGSYSPRRIPLMEIVCGKFSASPPNPQQDTRQELRQLFGELPNPAQALSSAWFAYRIAWLKIHYPPEFYSALTTSLVPTQKAMSALRHEMEARSLQACSTPSRQPAD